MIFLKLALLIPAVAAAATSGGSGGDCVLAGPDYPPPSKLCGSKALSSAIAGFEKKVNNATLGIKPNNTAWAVALFSWRENMTLYEHYYTPPISIGVEKVDKDSIFRIGSISKIFSVYSFLIEAGDRYFNEPITKYLPELANLSLPEQPGVLYDDINNVRWDEVTLGQLASQSAGILRDSAYPSNYHSRVLTEVGTSGELVNQMSVAQAISDYGLEPLSKEETLSCDVSGASQCTRQGIPAPTPCFQLLSSLETLRLIAKQHPLYAPQTSPAYSNIAFTLLGYAQDKITGKNFSTTVETSIIKPLGMSSSSYSAVPKQGVIPGGNASLVGFDVDLGESAPSGSFYSSTSDMVKAGMAMAQSRLLTQGATRRWFSPRIQTGYASSPVGAPWEIRYLTDENQHVVESYTKQGDLGNYHAGLAFSRQHELGWVAMTATTPEGSSDIRGELFNAFEDFFIPMGETQARKEAIVNFNGTYVDAASNSSVTILVGDDGRAGLGVPLMITRGKETIGPRSKFADIFHVGKSGRLYPSGLKTVKESSSGKGEYASRLGFRATFFNETSGSELDDPCLMAWTALGAPTFGQVSLDDWVFELGEDGKAETLDLRMWRLKLKRARD